MKLAVVTTFPKNKVGINDYVYHLVKSFRKKENVTEIILLTDVTSSETDLEFPENGCKLTIKKCWSFNSYRNIISVTKVINIEKPDAILFNLQFQQFGNKKLPNALSLALPFVCKLKRIPTIAMLDTILEGINLKSTRFTSNKFLQKIDAFVDSSVIKLIRGK